MYIFKHIADLQAHLANKRQLGNTIGFVPTMGALHAGHLSLIAAAQSATDCVVCSIFVNPTQFNEASDFDKYPRTINVDCGLLIEQHCDVLFLPDVAEIYPNGKTTEQAYDLGGLDLPMEGKQRPGHFAGMIQVVSRLLDIVQPNQLFMGQKDFQQLAIVRRYLETTASPIKLVGCATLREENGLAMSSRNVRLSPEQREQAGIINSTLQYLKQQYEQQPIAQLVQQGIEQINMLPNFAVEYLEVCDARTLQKITNWTDAPEIVACIALKVGDVRLIDNVLIK
jgi:pantoate--beta-alanine ligase